MDNVMQECCMEANTDKKMAIVADWLAQLVKGSLSIYFFIIFYYKYLIIIYLEFFVQ